MNSAARVLVTQGRFASGVFGATLNFDERYFWQPPGLGLLSALSYRVFGFGIWQTRLLPLLCGGVVVWLGGRIALQLTNNVAASAAASLLIAVDPRFITVARGSRMDTPAIGLLMAAVLIILKSNAWWAGGLAGVATAAACLTHPLSVIWLVPLAALSWRRGPKLTASFSLGGLAIAGVWLAWLLPNRSTFVDQFLHHGATRSKPDSVILRIPTNLAHFVQNSGRSPLIPLLAAVLLLVAVREWRKGDTVAGLLASVVAFTSLATLGLLNWNAGFYEQYWLPAVYVSAAVLVARKRSNLLLVIIALTVASGAVVSYGGRSAVLIREWDERDYSLVQTLVKKHVKRGDVVWGEPAVWYAVERQGAVLDLRDSDSPSVPLPKSPSPRRHNVLLVRSPTHVRAQCFHDLGYQFVGRTQAKSEPTYKLEVWRLRVVSPEIRRPKSCR
ncbi:MAG TPA: glycosyltransferase family 39 protein [Acidimicrobiales bacterium]|nr:glycosyltransferase family 39 protein [Acidimicrobiales bacterium]